MYVLRSLAVLMTDDDLIEAMVLGKAAQEVYRQHENWTKELLYRDMNQTLEDEFNGRVQIESGRDIGQAFTRLVQSGGLG